MDEDSGFLLYSGDEKELSNMKMNVLYSTSMMVREVTKLKEGFYVYFLH